MLNPTRAELEEKRKKENLQSFWMAPIAAVIGVLVGLFFNWAVSLILALVFGIVALLVCVDSAVESRTENDEPVAIYEFFEEREETVRKIGEIGQMRTTGRTLVFEKGKYREIETDKGTYILEMQGNQVVSCLKKD